MSETATAEATEATEPRRGRPRPAGTIERDDKVLAAITEAGPLTRAELAEKTGLAPNEVYLSLYRLKRDGKVGRGGEAGAQKWSAVAGEPEAAEAAPVA